MVSCLCSRKYRVKYVVVLVLVHFFSSVLECILLSMLGSSGAT